ncbi:MAG TPA: ATP-binding cassette domain-containing protein, partial [Solirubrobacteraceae bacterium]
HVRSAERARRARALIDRAGLRGREDADLSELSGGERQRVAIARALVHEPRLLLADEPTAALDDATSERVLEILEEARRERGMTMLAVTYDPAMISHTQRMLRLHEGTIDELPAAAVTPAGGRR